jgi:hypothetical protein
MTLTDASSVLLQYRAQKRFSRWPDLDRDGSSLCWLDRKDEHLLYLGKGVDPNLSGSNAGQSATMNALTR